MLEQDTAGKGQGDTAKEQLGAWDTDELGSRCSLELEALAGCLDRSPYGWEVPSSVTFHLGRYIHPHAHRVRQTGTGRGLAAVEAEPPIAGRGVVVGSEELGRVVGYIAAVRVEHMVAVHTAVAPDRAAVAVADDTAAERSLGGSSAAQSPLEKDDVERGAAEHARGAIAAVEDTLPGAVDEPHKLVPAAVRRVAVAVRMDRQEQRHGSRRDHRVTARLDLGQRRGHRAAVAVDKVGHRAAGMLQEMPKAELVLVPAAVAHNCRPSCVDSTKSKNWVRQN